MPRPEPIKEVTIKGFKSIKLLKDLELKKLNVLIGANGSGKSNFISFFKMLTSLHEGNLQSWVRRHGGAARILNFGSKTTESLSGKFMFGKNGYFFELAPSVTDGFFFKRETLHYTTLGQTEGLGSDHVESKLKETAEKKLGMSKAAFASTAIQNWRFYHFHETGDMAPMKKPSSTHTAGRLAHDGSNLAAFLQRMSREHPKTYRKIIKVLQLAIPFFDHFAYEKNRMESGEEQILLTWKQKGSDYTFHPSQLSDGSLRFICLATALLQPNPPTTVLIDEPELGLHPTAVTLLAALAHSESRRFQIIISTQSVTLVNEFSPEDIIVVEREDQNSKFSRLDASGLDSWLEEYTLGELWQKNILGGKPAP